MLSAAVAGIHFGPSSFRFIVVATYLVAGLSPFHVIATYLVARYTMDMLTEHHRLAKVKSMLKEVAVIVLGMWPLIMYAMQNPARPSRH